VSSDEIEHARPAEIVAQRVKEARESRGWSQEDLARRLVEIGYAKSRSALTKLEGGRFRGVSIDDVFALAAALGISPVYLLTPLADDAPVAISPRVIFPATVTRAWIRGDVRLPMLPDTDWRQVPTAELGKRVFVWLTRDMDRVQVNLMKDELMDAAQRLVAEVQAADREEAPVA
jgi:transcriptional regulator with XRE-family HTH domain